MPELVEQDCALPERDCQMDCGALVLFEPSIGPGYIDLPMDGETVDDQFASYIRKDLMMLVKYAAARVGCMSRDWAFGSGEPIVLGDMSEAGGDVPGTSQGAPAHQQSHRHGLDIDMAYYQIGTPDNHVRSICNTVDKKGNNQHHCVDVPIRLDTWRTALFIGALFESPNIRVVGVDGLAGPMIEKAYKRMCATKWIESSACKRGRIAYETKNGGKGWFGYHYNHFHVSVVPFSGF